MQTYDEYCEDYHGEYIELEPMNPTWKYKWIDALRSDKYKQTSGTLHAVMLDYDLQACAGTDAFCCLGVIEDIAGVQWEIPEWINDDPDLYQDDFAPMLDAHGNEEMPDFEFFKSEYGISENVVNYLADCNDNGATFAQIADWISENL